MAKEIKHISDLTPDSQNVNLGTERGHYMVDWSLTELGAGRSILADADGHVIAGNKTLEAAADHQLPVRVVQTDGRELVVVQRTDLRLTGKGKERERARQLAIADNRASEVGYAVDVEALLTHSQSGVDITPMFFESEVEALLAILTPSQLTDALPSDDLPGAINLDASQDETEEPFRGVFALQEGVLFPSSNTWGIPDLVPGKCSDQLPLEVYGRQEITDPKNTLFVHGTASFPDEARGGVLAFYVDDWRFERLWTDAVSVADEFRLFGWGSLVSPDFSVWRDDPTAVQLWNIYRSRWVARYWQEAGFQVIPSLNWSDERSYEFAHLGIPENLPIVSVQCRTTRSRKGKEYFVIRTTARQRIRSDQAVVPSGIEGRI